MSGSMRETAGPSGAGTDQNVHANEKEADHRCMLCMVFVRTLSEKTDIFICMRENRERRKP